MDYFSLYQKGVRNVIAASGTALTEGHGQIIKRFVNRVIFVFDGDEAGIKAAERSVFVFAPIELDVKVCILSNKEDPDSYISKHGIDSFKGLLNSAENSFRFLIRTGIERFGIDSASGKASVVKYLTPIMKASSNPVVVSELIRTVAAEIDISEMAIRTTVRQNLKNDSVDKSQNLIVPQDESVLLTDDGSFIHLLINRPDIFIKIKEKISVETFSEIYIKKLYSIISVEIDKYGDLENLLLHATDDKVKSTIAMMMITDLPEDDAEQNATHKLKRFMLREKKWKFHEGTRKLRGNLSPVERNKQLIAQQILIKRYRDSLKEDGDEAVK